MHITEQQYPKLWKKHDDLSITERTQGFDVDYDLYLRFRQEADETMANLRASLCEVSTGEELRYATDDEIKLSKSVNDGPIMVDDKLCFVAEIDKEIWAIYNAHMHPGFSQNTNIPEISMTKSSPHSTAGLPKILDAAQHLISSLNSGSDKVAEAIKSEKSHQVGLRTIEPLKTDNSHRVAMKVTVEHQIPALDMIIALLKPRASHYKMALLVALWAIVFMLIMLLTGVKLHAQTVTIRGIPNGTTTASTATVTATCIADHNCFDVDLLNIPHIICDSGCGGAASFSDNSSFTVGSTAINVIGAYYTSGAAPTLSTGNAGRVRMDSSSYLYVDCVVGCSGGATTPTDAFANPTTAGIAMTFNAGYNGSSWDLLRSGDKNNVTGIVGVLNTAPVGRYNATQPTLTDTRYNLWQLSSRGELLVSPGVSGFPVTLTSTTITGTVGVTQSTSPWVVSNGGTFATQSAITAASGSISSGALASGSIASGACASGCFASGAISDGADVTLGAKADAKSTATDTTAITIMSVLKEVSAMEQAPASRAVTNAGTFATQSAITAASGSIASGAIASGAVASGAVASGAIASGACVANCIVDGGVATLGLKADAKSTATDTTAITAMQVLKEISFMAQTPAALPANQSTNLAQVNAHTTIEAGVNGSQAVGGCVATNTATPCNPMNLGAQAVSSENSAATTAREVQLVADLVGKLIVLPYANPENFLSGVTAAITDTTSTSLIASSGGSLRTYITNWSCTNSHATVGTFIKLLDNATIKAEMYAAPAGGGFTVTMPTPLVGTAATAWNVQAVTTGANFICNAVGYKGL